jgi:putative phosphoserine phosphatase/1-acylglycerol-3-phosphate O-acyltransferase
MSEHAVARRRSKHRVGAFFDMDKTLICENSGSVYFKHRYEQGEIGAIDLIKGLGAYMQYKAGILDIAAWTRQMMSEFAGQREADLAEEAQALFEQAILPSVYPEAEAIVREHRARGHVVAIVSGATRFVVEPLARHLDVEHMLYTGMEVEDGLFTGRVIEPVCFEEGKIFWLQQFIERESIDLARSWFYTDSVTDLPLLELVGHPVPVNPDPFLYRTAVRRRWPVRLFEPPESQRSAKTSNPKGASGPGPKRPRSLTAAS